MVADLSLQPLNLWRFYNNRAGIEPVIHQLKKILLMPAQLVRTGNRSRLNLPVSGHRDVAWPHARRTIERLNV